MTFSRKDLHALIGDKMRDYRFVVVANREPFIHKHRDGGIEVQRPASGMAAALHPVMLACDGTWVAHGSGDADREVVDAHDRIRVPPEDPGYTLRRVWLTPEEEEGYYYGIANGGLWPLCHITFTRPKFEPDDWETYRAVNRRFADAVLEEVGADPAFIFIQDFHFGLLPRMLKEAHPRLVIAQFWHIPWPNREVFRTFPWGEELLDGLLGNDLLGFHVQYHCQNFLDTVDRGIEARVDLDNGSMVHRGGHATEVRPFPISIDFRAHDAQARSLMVQKAMERWRQSLNLGDELIGVGLERLDYTKGIPDRLRGIDYLLQTHAEYRGRMRFIQVAVPSRTRVVAYQQVDREVDDLVEEINDRWRQGDWEPITYVKEHQGPVDMMALHRLAHFCIVSSLHDGMNLVAKEFVACRFDDDGVLILSRFTGSARELPDAVPINPFSIAETAEAIHQAFSMPPEERQRRMRRMREQVERNNVYRWAGKILSGLLKFDFPGDSDSG
ncbi:MAG: trehalose-6-phosphate synthase [Isosphaeraceae bacterium]